MTESDLNKLFTVHTKNLRRILRILWLRTISNYHHAKAVEMDRTCDEKRARQHLSHSPSLDTIGEAETKSTQEHLASNCRRGAKILHHTWGTVQKLAQSRQEWVPLLLPYSPAGKTGMSE